MSAEPLKRSRLSYYVHKMNTLYSFCVRFTTNLNSHSCGLPQLPFKGEPGKGLNSTFLEEFKHQTVPMDLTSATHHHRQVDTSAPHSPTAPLYSPGCGCLKACWALQDVFRGCMTKVRRLAEGLQMTNHSPGCVEGAQCAFDTIFAPENGAYSNVG